MPDPIRVLQVKSTLDRGGAEAVVMDWLRRIDRNEVTFDFVVNDDAGPYAYEHEAQLLGSRIVRAPRFRVWNVLPYTAWWYRCLRRHEEWRIVHAHHTVPAFAFLSVARVLRRTTIAHSHTAGRDELLLGLMRVVLRWPLRFLSDVLLACSSEAGEWMFGRKTSVRVIPNAIDTERFGFDQDERLRLRVELDFHESFVVGHVGSFSKPKNHKRLLQIFAALAKRESSARLLLVGDGGLRSEIEQDVQDFGLSDKVRLLGVREDVSDLLSAMDVLLFPSLVEGLPVTLVEAQAAGLPCVVSDTITREVGLTDLVRFVSLDEPDEAWADAVLEAASTGVRTSRVEELRASGYDSAHVAAGMQKLYLNLSQQRKCSRTDCEESHD